MCDRTESQEDRKFPAALLNAEGVVGVSQIQIRPAFTGPTICTLAYSAETVQISVVDARGDRASPFRGTITRPLCELRRFGPLASWSKLCVAASTAPSCTTLARDGVRFHHGSLDRQRGTQAIWSNPSWFAHRQQCELAEAYEALIESTGILLEEGTRVRILTGLMAGIAGRIVRLKRNEGRIRVSAELGGMPTVQDLTVCDVVFEPERTEVID